MVDLMRLRRRIGEPVAQIALRRYVTSPGRNIGELMDMARELDVLGPVRAEGLEPSTRGLKPAGKCPTSKQPALTSPLTSLTSLCDQG